MTNLEKRIMASRGYKHPFVKTNVDFSVYAYTKKPEEPAPEGYEYQKRPFGNSYRWYLVKSDSPEKKVRENAPKVISALFKTGTEPGTTSKLLGDTAATIVDTVSGNS